MKPSVGIEKYEGKSEENASQDYFFFVENKKDFDGPKIRTKNIQEKKNRNMNQTNYKNLNLTQKKL